MAITLERIRESLERRWYLGRMRAATRGKHGLEIGGPSGIFSPAWANIYLPPVYALAARLDNCNFAASTVWSEGEAGHTFVYHPGAPVGRQFVGDATNLSSIPDGHYDFLLASHVLEHVANPLKALLEWRRVLKPGGHLLMLLPEKTTIFDHRRPYTTLAHLRQDFDRNTAEDDLTHLDEVLAFHDLDRDQPAGTPAQFRERSLRNLENRCLHHHVFSPEVAKGMLRLAGFDPQYVTTRLPPNLILFARRSRLSPLLPADSSAARAA